MTRFFTADTHFSLVDHVYVRDFRPFTSEKKHNKGIIKIWNKQLKPGDTIYHLGDFVNYNQYDKNSYDKCFDLVKKIKAKVILILGNNEIRILNSEFNGDFEKFKEYLKNKGFYDVIQNGMEVEIGGIKFYLTHKPKDHKDGMENLFGHIHGTGFVKKYGFNIGIDNHYLGMFSESEILEMVSRRKFFDENVYD